MKIDGSCHCGFIKYEAEVNPEEVYVCHCTDCQSISGSAFRWAVSVPEEDFRLLSGEPKTYVKTADSGSTSHQLFCPECASPLYSTSIGDGPKFYNLRLGTMSSMQGHGSVDEQRQFSKFLLKLIEDEPEFSLENAEPAVLPRGEGWRARIDTAHRDERQRFRYVLDKEGDSGTGSCPTPLPITLQYPHNR